MPTFLPEKPFRGGQPFRGSGKSRLRAAPECLPGRFFYVLLLLFCSAFPPQCRSSRSPRLYPGGIPHQRPEKSIRSPEAPGGLYLRRNGVDGPYGGHENYEEIIRRLADGSVDNAMLRRRAMSDWPLRSGTILRGHLHGRGGGRITPFSTR